MFAKLLSNLVMVFTIICVSCEAAAQSDIALATNKAELQTLSDNLKQRDDNDRREVQEFARRAGIPVRRELPNGGVLELQRIAPGIGPIFYITNNIIAADTVSTDDVWPGGIAGLNLDGSGMTVAEWDGGAIFADHPDFTGRLTQVDGATVVSGHSTHVAGTLIGSGDTLLDSRGMAYAAHLNAYDWNSDTAEMALAASNGELISNHSYGIAAGWLYIGDVPPDQWWWIGGANPADVEDPNFGYYDSETQLWDQIAFDAPYYLIVKAAGNDRTDIGPVLGELYTVIDQDGMFLFTSTLPRNADCAPAGYDCMPSASVAKNILTVGAVDDLVGGYTIFTGPSSVQMAVFSGWGPTDDGRIKPDVVGNGMFLFSAWPDSPYFALAAGTSMSAPNVTGSLLLLQEHYEDINGPGNFMRAATLKALAIHTADEAGGADGPDYEFGWGLLNTKSAAQVITDNGGAHQIIEGSLVDGTVDTVEIVVTEADVRITATLVWTDSPGTVVAPTLDPTDLMLVNDLDLRINSGPPPQTYMPWVLDPASPAAAATTGDNFRDNVEQVVIEGVGTGSYFVEVSHKGTLLNGNNQNYSLIISVKPTPPITSTLFIDENFTGGLPAGWSVDTVKGVSWTINTPIPGHFRLDNLTGSSGEFAIVDNYSSANTITSLRTPTFDLSSATAVVLRFRSSFQFDFLESINVDISTDGGTGWTTVWQNCCVVTGPTQYVLDLTGVAGGQASFMLRFRFDSGGEIAGNYWQVDAVKLEVFGGSPPGNPPGQASGPNPADGASGLGLGTALSWTAGTLATSHDVYFGTNPAPASQGNQAGTTFDPGPLEHSTTYYWQIDEVNSDGTTTGVTWSFTTEVMPGPASNPGPADGAIDVSVNGDLSWTAGSDATSHDVYLNGVLQGNQPGTTYDPGTMAYSTTYNWRIDEVNAAGTTTGSTWSLTTEGVPVLPGLASSPSPSDGAIDVNVDGDLSWTAGSDATSHDVYFNGVWQVNQTGTTFDPGTLAYSTTYNWRIDEVNSAGTTSGPVWGFTTIGVPALPEFQIFDIDEPKVVPANGRKNRGRATVTVHDEFTSPVVGVDISGTFSGDWSGTRSDITDTNGQIVVETPPIKNGSSWQFCVDTASKIGWTFDQTSSASWLCGPPPAVGSIIGAVVEEVTGNPIQGAIASADTGQSDSTDSGGNYTLANVLAGNRTVTVDASGYDSALLQVTVSDGNTSILNFVLTPTATGGGSGTLKGTVKSISGVKLSGVTVQVDGGPSSTTNKGGKYTIKNVDEGAQSVTASMPGYVDSTESVTILAGSTTTHNFDLTPNP